MAEQADLERLVEQHYGHIYRAALVMTGSVADAEDLAQETFLQALRGHRRFAGRSRPETWLYAILINQRRRQQRSLSRSWRRLMGWFQRYVAPAATADAEQQMMLAEWRASLWSCVAELPDAQRDALVLRYAEGMTYEQIGQVLSCPVGTAKSRVHYALTTLQRRLMDQPGENKDLALATEHELIRKVSRSIL